MKARLLLVSALVLMMSGLGYCNYPGDCNGDRMVDDLDFLLVIGNFGSTDPDLKLLGDCNGDGETNDLDFLLVLDYFGTDARNNFTGEMVYIPAGSFQMGNSGVGNDAVYGNTDELPQHWVTLSSYWIGKYEVTCGEYQQFMDAGGYANSAYWSSAGWAWKVDNVMTQPLFWIPAQQNWGSGTFTQTDSYPVVGVSYYEAEAFCNWAGGHLPTEAQWEKAVRWDGHPRVYPWGDSWEPEKCNNWDDTLYPIYQTAPVGSYATGGSPYGCVDMAGNVWEWCKDWYKSYPGSSSPFDYTNSSRVLRGGSWGDGDGDAFLRCAARSRLGPALRYFYYGFRCARTP